MSKRQQKTCNSAIWAEIKAQYLLGKSIYNLSQMYEVSESTIRSRRDNENWCMHLRSKVAEARELIKNFAYSDENVDVEDTDLKLIKRTLDKEIDESLDLVRTLSFIKSKSMHQHKKILNDSIEMYDNKKIDVFQSAKLLATQGLTVKDVVNFSGLSEEKKEKIEVDKSVSRETISSEISDKEASRLYQEMIK
jgi:hypothetical protein